MAKLKMFLNFFRHYTSENPPKERELIFARKVLRETFDQQTWISSPKLIQPVKLFKEGKIEDSKGSLHIDFANKFIGGGALSFGCVQEEIMFSRAPEFCASMAMFVAMEDNEAIYISGAKYFSDYSGYARSLQYAGDHEENLKSQSKTEEVEEELSIVAIDAIPFGNPRNPRQFESDQILRELNKAYIGFLPGPEETQTSQSLKPIATGNWGCGAFGGKLQLKALIQLMAVSQAGRTMEYFIFGEHTVEGLGELAEALINKKRTVGWLSDILLGQNQRAQERKEPMLMDIPNLFQFILRKNDEED